MHTLDEANDIMNLNGLSQWKKQAVTNIMKTKQNVFNTEVNSKAIELANNFSLATLGSLAQPQAQMGQPVSLKMLFNLF